MDLQTELREYASAALQQGKSALDQGRAAVERMSALLEDTAISETWTSKGKPPYWAVGAADAAAQNLAAAAESALRQVEAAIRLGETPRTPQSARDRWGKAQEDTVGAAARAHEDALARLAELRHAIDAAFSSARAAQPSQLPGSARSAAESYLAALRARLDLLGERGEQRTSQLREQVQSQLHTARTGDVEAAVEAVQTALRPVLETVFGAAFGLLPTARPVEQTAPPAPSPPAAPPRNPAAGAADDAAGHSAGGDSVGDSVKPPVKAPRKRAAAKTDRPKPSA